MRHTTSGHAWLTTSMTMIGSPAAPDSILTSFDHAIRFRRTPPELVLQLHANFDVVLIFLGAADTLEAIPM